MKMRRSLWRKLLVVAFAILAVVSTVLTIQLYNTNHEQTKSGITMGKPTYKTEENPEEGLPYLCTVNVPLINTNSVSKDPVSIAVTFSNGLTLEIPILSEIQPGETYNATATFPIDSSNSQISAISITFSSKVDEVLLGPKATKELPDYIWAMIAISIILIGTFVYTCVALYKSPKLKVHSKHRHHHHHHHSSHSESSEATENK